MLTKFFNSCELVKGIGVGSEDAFIVDFLNIIYLGLIFKNLTRRIQKCPASFWSNELQAKKKKLIMDLNVQERVLDINKPDMTLHI